MALDTRDRRASAVHVGLPWRGLLPLPDAPAEDQGDRQQMAGFYRGVLAGPASLPATGLRFGAASVIQSGFGVATLIPAGAGAATLIPAGFGVATLED